VLGTQGALPRRKLFAGLQKPAANAGREARMVPFFVQIKCQLGKSYEVANELADAEIASEIYSTAGDFDLLVKFYVEPGTDIGHFVNEKVQTIPGIQNTRTIITFKAFSR
jgi:DNA-binding Lrp family transcriptional regulator